MSCVFRVHVHFHRKGRTEKTLSVYMDPANYDYTGGSTAAMRAKWFDPTLDDFDECTCVLYFNVNTSILLVSV